MQGLKIKKPYNEMTEEEKKELTEEIEKRKFCKNDELIFDGRF